MSLQHQIKLAGLAIATLTGVCLLLVAYVIFLNRQLELSRSEPARIARVAKALSEVPADLRPAVVDYLECRVNG